MRPRGFIALGPLAYLVIGLAILGALAGLYALVDRNWATTAGVDKGMAIVQARWDAKAREQRAAEEKQAAGAATKLETDNAKARTVYRTITRTVDRYIDREVYRNLCLDADGLRDANAALRGGAAADPAQPDKSVPGPHPALRWDRGERLAQADRGG